MATTNSTAPSGSPDVVADGVPTGGIRTVVVPAAGLGTRFLPATKTVPKELLPVVDTPGIELIAKEASEAGASRLAVVTSPRKQGIMAFFDRDELLEDTLESRGKTDQLNKVRAVNEMITAVSVNQDRPLGLGHAIGCAEDALDEDEDAFAVLLPDDLVLPFGVMNEMIEVRKRLGGTVLCGFEVPEDEVSNYGVFEVAEPDDELGDQVRRVTGMVEKPDAADAPSNIVATGRYLLDRSIFDALRRTEPGKGGENQVTDAIAKLIEEGHPVHVYVHRGNRHDLGNPGGFIRACVDFALDDPSFGPSLEKWLEQRLDK
ncbi:MAG: UTP--glucose-1-phosphate uridylyltransferase [Corynebacterium sp.]|nr:UTP--glucose-1-phosphate uridylyltransferase [Corynebacterium sp.]